MKYLRKNCVRCESEIDPVNIEWSENVYICSSCNSVASIFEERDFLREEKELYQPEGIWYEYLGADLHIHLDRLPSGEMHRSLIGTGLIVLFFVAIFAIFQQEVFLTLTLILGIGGWVVNLLAYIRWDFRTYEVELSAHQVKFFEKLAGAKRLIKSIDSYAIDRIVILTSDNENVSGSQKTNFIIQTKQYEKIKPLYHSRGRENQLEYLKLLMDNYLNIHERSSDINE